MNFGNIMDLIAKNNINPEDVFTLVDRIKNADLKDETTIRLLIKDASKIANKKLDKQKEDALVKKILSDGINEDLLSFL